MRLRLANQVRALESRSAALVENVDREVAGQQAQAVLNIRQAQRRIVLVFPVTAAITLVFAAFLGSVITRSITQPLGRLVEGATPCQEAISLTECQPQGTMKSHGSARFSTT